MVQDVAFVDLKPQAQKEEGKREDSDFPAVGDLSVELMSSYFSPHGHLVPHF